MQRVPLHYISLLRSLYKDQSAEVQGRSCSRSFSITIGVKQGDSISALLFIAIMEDFCGQLKTRWTAANRRRKGAKIGIEMGAEYLMNLRFADDVVLVAQNKSDIKKMLNDFSACAKPYGLNINVAKTTVLT